MIRESMIEIPSSVLDRAVEQLGLPRSPLENLPNEILIQICHHIDLFSLVNIAITSTRLASFIHTTRLLYFDPDNISAAEATLILDSIPLQTHPAELAMNDFQPFLSSQRRTYVMLRPAGIFCRSCDYYNLRTTSSKSSYENAWCRHLCMEVEHKRGRVTRRMLPLLCRSFDLLEREYDRKLRRAAFLTLKVPRPLASQKDNDTA